MRSSHIDLFSGIGGFALAAHWAGYTPEVFCERDPFCQRVLQHHWPAVPIISDIRDFDGKAYRGADLLTGGFPCQPFSTAGKRGGATDDRFLWPEMLRVISEARPHWVVAENVPGIISMALDDVLSDLENEGYEVGTLVVPACGVNAPHKRERVWIIAHRQCAGTRMEEHRNSGQGWEFADSLEPAILRQENRATGAEGNHANCAVMENAQRGDGEPIAGDRHRVWRSFARGGSHADISSPSDQSETLADARCIYEYGRPDICAGDGIAHRERLTYRPQAECPAIGGVATLAHPHRHDQHGWASDVQVGRFRESGETENDGVPGRTEWQSQSRLGERDDGLPGRLVGYWDGDWERGIPRVCGKIPDRAAKLKALGNAIVPQVAYEILRMIQS